MPSINMVPFDKIDHEVFNMLIDMEDKTLNSSEYLQFFFT